MFGPGDDMHHAAFDDAIAERYDAHVDAFHRGNAVALVDAFFTPDAVWEASGFGRVEGRDALIEFFAGVVGVSTVAFEPIRSFGSGDAGWTLADYPVVPLDGAPPFWFRCMFGWRRAEDGWRANACLAFTVDDAGGER